MADKPSQSSKSVLTIDSKESHLEFYQRWHRLAQPYFRWQFLQFERHLGDRVADIGCGLGNFTDFLMDKELYVGVDYDIELLAELNRNHGGRRNVEVLHADITNGECVEPLRDRKPDSILCVNVLEHIEDDDRAIGNLVDVLPRGGTLCLLVPALQFLYGTLDKLDGHFRRYNIAMIKEKLKKHPLAVKEIYYFNFSGALGWLLKGRILRASTQDDENYRLMNLLIPLMSKIERACRPPFGMSLVVVAEKNRESL